MWPAIAILTDTSFTEYPADGTFTIRWEPLALNGFRASHRLGVSGRMTNATSIAVPTLVSLDDVRMAAAALRGIAVRTPLLPSDALHAQFGVPVFLKPEMLQRGGAFKFRGAYWFLSQLSAEQRPRPRRAVVGQSWTSRRTGRETLRCARDRGHADHRAACKARRSRTSRRARDIRRHHDRRAHEEGGGDLRARRSDFVPPFDDPTIIAGQGTIGLEIAEDLPDVDLVLVPVGGGGLSAGVAAAVKRAAPAARVIGVEPAGSPKLTRAREAGAPVTIAANPGGLADGLLAVRVGDLNYAHHQAFIDDVVTVGDELLPNAVRFLLDRHKLVAEPSGAITVAAILEGIVKPGCANRVHLLGR